MKTIKIVNEEISHLKSMMVMCDKKTKEGRNGYKKFEKDLLFKKELLRYLETNPTEEFIKKESDRITNRVNLLIKNYEDHIAPDEEHAAKLLKKDLTKLKKDYEKEMGIPKLRKHLSTLNYLMN